MNTLALYDRVNLTAPLSKPEFIAFFNDSTAYIVAKYGEKYACDGKYTELSKVEDGSNINSLYSDAIADNIVFLKTGNVDRKTDFVEKAGNAYKTVWSSTITKHQMKLRRF
jgi:hypothetical protein